MTEKIAGTNKTNITIIVNSESPINSLNCGNKNIPIKFKFRYIK